MRSKTFSFRLLEVEKTGSTFGQLKVYISYLATLNQERSC
uniref:Uncharacterized protein n=2 Tax=Musa acuminata subsp. malaccensis TaxID=214687 RepID=A0A804K4C9_MUSAM